MTNEDVLKHVKFNLGITTNVRDEYLKFIIESSISRLKRAGIDPEGQGEDYQNEYYYYLSDEVAWYYRNRGGETPLPVGLLNRRNTLITEKKYV